VILTMLMLGLLAGCVPARRALAMDPAMLLRELLYHVQPGLEVAPLYNLD
jgi:hypothetical protein